MIRRNGAPFEDVDVAGEPGEGEERGDLEDTRTRDMGDAGAAGLPPLTDVESECACSASWGG